MLYDSGVWYGQTDKVVEKLDSVDHLFFRKLFNVTCSCPKEAYYLETKGIPMGMIIKARRLNYLHHLITREPAEMISKVFLAQWRWPLKHDWTEQIKDDIAEFGIPSNLDQIKTMSKYKFKLLLKRKYVT